MVDFLRGTLVAERREMKTLHYSREKRLHGFLLVDMEGGQRVTILDELLRLPVHLTDW